MLLVLLNKYSLYLLDSFSNMFRLSILKCQMSAFQALSISVMVTADFVLFFIAE